MGNKDLSCYNIQGSLHTLFHHSQSFYLPPVTFTSAITLICFNNSTAFSAFDNVLNDIYLNPVSSGKLNLIVDDIIKDANQGNKKDLLA